MDTPPIKKEVEMSGNTVQIEGHRRNNGCFGRLCFIRRHNPGFARGADNLKGQPVIVQELELAIHAENAIVAPGNVAPGTS